MSNKKTMSWGWIIFWFVIFWPIGLFFLFKKISTDKTATLKNSKTIANVSYVLIGFGVIYLMMAIGGDSEMLFAAFLFGGGGIWVNVISRNMKKTGKRYKKYIDIVVNQNMTMLDNIASTCGVTYEVAKIDLQKMIDTGYFEGAYINETMREIVLKKQEVQQQMQQYSVNIQSKVCTCKSCGAKNTVFGLMSECEYCGSPIES